MLVYYAIANREALRVSEQHRLYRRLIPFAGLIGCWGGFLIEREAWVVGGPKDGAPCSLYVLLDRTGEKPIVDFVRLEYDIADAGDPEG